MQAVEVYRLKQAMEGIRLCLDVFRRRECRRNDAVRNRNLLGIVLWESQHVDSVIRWLKELMKHLDNWQIWEEKDGSNAGGVHTCLLVCSIKDQVQMFEEHAFVQEYMYKKRLDFLCLEEDVTESHVTLMHTQEVLSLKHCRWIWFAYDMLNCFPQTQLSWSQSGNLWKHEEGEKITLTWTTKQQYLAKFVPDYVLDHTTENQRLNVPLQLLDSVRRLITLAGDQDFFLLFANRVDQGEEDLAQVNEAFLQAFILYLGGVFLPRKLFHSNTGKKDSQGMFWIPSTEEEGTGLAMNELYLILSSFLASPSWTCQDIRPLMLGVQEKSSTYRFRYDSTDPMNLSIDDMCRVDQRIHCILEKEHLPVTPLDEHWMSIEAYRPTTFLLRMMIRLSRYDPDCFPSWRLTRDVLCQSLNLTELQAFYQDLIACVPELNGEEDATTSATVVLNIIKYILDAQLNEKDDFRLTENILDKIYGKVARNEELLHKEITAALGLGTPVEASGKTSELQENETLTIMLEENVQFSESMLWNLSKRYYDSVGTLAWGDDGSIPSFITTNSYIATQYAEMIFAMLQDQWRHQLEVTVTMPNNNNNEPWYILDVGAGTGKFGFLVVTALLRILGEQFYEEVEELCSTLCPKMTNERGWKPFQFVYVLTDFTMTNVEWWRKQAQLKSFVDRNLVDFAVFDVEQNQEVTLLESGKRLSSGGGHNIALIANYLFDSLTCDVFRVQSGQLFEGRVSCSVIVDKQELVDEGITLDELKLCLLADASIMNDLKITFSYHPIESKGYYSSPLWTHVLETYSDILQNIDQSFFLPIGSFKCIENVLSWTRKGERSEKEDGNFFVLSSDKGVVDLSSLKRLIQEQPYVDKHGSMSVVANFHALEIFFTKLGGFSLLDEKYSRHIKTCLFGITSENKLSDCTYTLRAFESIRAFSPDDFFNFLHHMKTAHSRALSLDEILSFIHLSSWDPDVFFILRNELRIRAFQNQSAESKTQISLALEKISSHFFHIHDTDDILFEVGRVAMACQNYQLALKALQRSNALSDLEHRSKESAKLLAESHRMSLEMDDEDSGNEEEDISFLVRQHFRVHAWHLLGLSSLALGQVSHAQEAFQTCQTLDPTFPDAHRMLQHILNNK